MEGRGLYYAGFPKRPLTRCTSVYLGLYVPGGARTFARDNMPACVAGNTYSYTI